MLSTVLQYIEEKHACPHCEQTLTLCHAPPVHVGDGLGWGSEYLFICLNDECSLFVNGWDHISNQYGHVGSYRHMQMPNSKENYNMMVVGKEAFTGSVVDLEALKRRNVDYQRRQEAIEALDHCVERGQLEPVLAVLLDEGVRIEDRKKAAHLLVPLNDIACIEPIRNYNFRDGHLEQEVNLAIKAVLAAHFLKECPYCAELIKARANVCKHCQRQLNA
ncbi:zinc ribbon domain-containing protein [Desulfobulbus alkaliphilus]|uniref:zinc ribbon domain-containing protein n=1 Tax=Desulfobulbus alkaliphilus TaxID=869814 RepID=UPI001965C1F4|nr:zinc ribbon domain-containing protein [Desulfobulbus alkaliphilus]MBM9535724.1 zinc ribbon domain-containing protein [Desulfobulbus alkaliphilus]